MAELSLTTRGFLTVLLAGAVLSGCSSDDGPGRDAGLGAIDQSVATSDGPGGALDGPGGVDGPGGQDVPGAAGDGGADTLHGDTHPPGDGAADGRVVQSGEGIYCSSDPREDPLYVCQTGLSCAATHRPTLPDGSRGPPAFLCRPPCTPQGTCSQGVCCAGKAGTGQTVYVCTEPSFCTGLN